jgi:hypothetical protein
MFRILHGLAFGARKTPRNPCLGLIKPEYCYALWSGPSSSSSSSSSSLSSVFLSGTQRRRFGGYIEDAQLAMLGQELYRDLHGPEALVPKDFVVPLDGEGGFTSNLYGYELGKAVVKHNLQPATRGTEGAVGPRMR